MSEYKRLTKRRKDCTVNTQLEPLYFGIMNGCAFIRGEVKELAEQYGVEVEE